MLSFFSVMKPANDNYGKGSWDELKIGNYTSSVVNVDMINGLDIDL